ncbi:MAG: hypothetical protein P4L35_02835 [Ignavibacteriaceae bacterium]|nr:hypothetical protein [Ignavibacteriaceae bacterium]
MKLNYQVSNNSSEISSNGMVQSYLTTISTVMENDIYKVGYRISDPNKLNIADSNRFSYKADVNNDGTADSVRYYLGTTSQAGKTSNPNDKPLYKVLNGGTSVSIGFVRDCHFTYYDSTGRQILSYANPTNVDTLKKVRVINVYIKCESPYLINNYYQTAEYSRKIKPVNLK